MDVIEKARELGKALQQDERYLRLVKANQANDADETLQDLIGKFNLKRMEINQEVTKEQKDSDKLSKLDAEFKELYKTIMSRPTMVEYNAAKQDMESLVTFINQIVVDSANGEDPDTIEQATGCSGSCSSCSGCH